MEARSESLWKSAGLAVGEAAGARLATGRRLRRRRRRVPAPHGRRGVPTQHRRARELRARGVRARHVHQRAAPHRAPRIRGRAGARPPRRPDQHHRDAVVQFEGSEALEQHNEFFLAFLNL